MRMISPQLDAPQIYVAEDQDEFTTITAALARHPGYPSGIPGRGGSTNTHIVAFRLTDEERARVAAGADFYVALLTFGGPMTPILVSVGPEEMAAWHGVAVER